MSVFFEKSENKFIGTADARSPWDENALNGVLIAGLFGYLFEQQVDFNIMNPGRVTIDILRPVPREVETDVRVVRGGKKVQMLEASLHQQGEVYARAFFTCIRKAKMPVFTSPGQQPFNFPLPSDDRLKLTTLNFIIAPSVYVKPVINAFEIPGHGVIWLNFHYDLFEGAPLTPFVRACMLSDMGHGTARALDARKWLYVNVDINIIFTRMPETKWLLVDARMESEGKGSALAYSQFADEKGFYAMGTQTLFIDKR